MTRHFVTGGAGFIGSHLVDRLLAEGNTVTVYDNLISGNHRNIRHHLDDENFTFLQGDLRDYHTLAQAMKGHDVIWHLGANTDIPTGNKVTDLDLQSCTAATRNVLEAMRMNEVRKLLFASSACVYGDAPESGEPLAEASGPLLPINLYGAGKLACEGLISAYCHLFDRQAWIFRFANVVGGRMGHGVIYDFIQKLRRNPGELEVLGDGRQEKPYFLVEDCIEGMLCAFNNSDRQYDVFNLGGDTYTRVTRIGEIVAEEMGLQDVKFRYTGGKRGWPGDAPVIHFNTDKINGLGWWASRTSDEVVREAARRLLETTV